MRSMTAYLDRLKGVSSHLSFSDWLNSLLLLLTLLSIWLARDALRVAQVTLDVARKAGEDQERQFEQQTHQSKNQFDQQTRQSVDQFNGQVQQLKDQVSELKISREALQHANERLADQSRLLRKLQNISALQSSVIAEENERQKRQAAAHPVLFLSVTCSAINVVSVAHGSSNRLPTDRKIELDHDGMATCYVYLANQGDQEFRNSKLDVSVASLAGKVIIIPETDLPSALTNPLAIQGRSNVTIFEGAIPPTDTTRVPIVRMFDLRPEPGTQKFSIQVTMTSDNAPVFVETHTLDPSWISK